MTGLLAGLSTVSWQIFLRLLASFSAAFCGALADADSMLAAGVFYNGTTLKMKRFVHDDPIWRRPMVGHCSTADTMVAAALL
jgi:hypothetical protein